MKVYWEGNSTILMDVVDDLPKHKNYPFNWRKSSRYYDIKDRKIKYAILHQKAGGYATGFKGIQNTNAFFIEEPKYDDDGKWIGNGRGWPGYAYTIDIPFIPETKDGKYIIYLCNHFDTVSWHTSGWNEHGVGIAFQGYFKSRHLRGFKPFKGQSGKPASVQMEILEDLWSGFLKVKFELTDKDIFGHFEAPAPKLSCPGDDLEEWIMKKRGANRRAIEIPVALPMEGNYDLGVWEKRQGALLLLGCQLGSTGPNHDGIDGDPGERTRLAVESIERSSGLPADGVWDNKMEAALRKQLISKGITQKQIDDLTK